MENNSQKNWLKITKLETDNVVYWNTNQMNWISLGKNDITFRLSTDEEIINFSFNEYKVELVFSTNMFPSTTTLAWE